MDRQRTLVLAGAGATVTAAILALGLRRPRRHGYGVLRPVDYVDLTRFAGRWFEIARNPARFERDCAKNATAEYSLRDDGQIAIENRCTLRDGRIDIAHGVATIADASSNAKLRVKFSRFMPAADYWIIDLDEDYQWAVVGEPSRRYVWILARAPELDESVFADVCSRLVTQGYDPDRLVRTPQDGG